MRFIKNFAHLLEAVFWNCFYFFPSRKMKVIGVTGTDGKTTTAFLIYQILNYSGKKAALVATTGAFIGDERIQTGLHTTSPAPRILQKLIYRAKVLKTEYLILEITSHGLDQHRFWGINFDIGVLTNITHEHLDYHKNLKSYSLTKAKLFNKSRVGIINREYSNFVRFIRNKNLKVVFYSPFRLPLVLRRTVFKKFAQNYNRENAAAALFAVKELGLRDNEIDKALKEVKAPEGRLELVKNRKGLKVIIDFAHTPNALGKLLNYLKKEKKSGRLIVVFGSAGERDKIKRPLMGKVASELADILVLTAEDPRGESVEEIIKSIKSGIKRREVAVFEIENRGRAIYYALNKLAKRGDTVVVCGKGHERSLCVGDVEYSWSDKEAVIEALKGKVFSYGKVLSKKL